MEFQDIIPNLFNYGGIGAITVYLLWERSKTLKQLTETLADLKEAVNLLKALHLKGAE